MNQIDADFFRTLAWYNARVNDAMAAVLEPRAGLCLEPGTTYYGSILGLLSHISLADITWLRRAGAHDKMDDTAPLDLKYASVDEQPFGELVAWRSHRAALDAAIERWVGRFGQGDVARTITYRNSRGREFQQPLWQILLHMFNHQTHHRGQLAQALDDRGVENDFSNLIWYLRA